ncbi:hypothetical protein [Sphingomonas sp.]|uniref:hypothetical protein n=1 Tax=Sphingomonas sp. TaxID=28214 RepID=UPI003B3B3D4A
MRLLLLLSALLSALSGVVTGTAVAAGGVEASVSVEKKSEVAQTAVARAVLAAGVYAPHAAWTPVAIGPQAALRPLYAERRRE